MTEGELAQLLARNPALKVAGADRGGITAPKVLAQHATSPPAQNSPSKTERAGGKGPNKTESSYGNLLALEFPGCKIVFEGIRLRLDNGDIYTPDWVVHAPDGLLLVEVKNAAYKHASYGRSKMAFKQCRIDWPMFGYRWAEKDKDTWRLLNQ